MSHLLKLYVNQGGLVEVFKDQFFLKYYQKHKNTLKEWFLRYMFLSFTFTNMNQKSIISTNCLCHLHFHILPHQNILHCFQCYHQCSIYFSISLTFTKL